MIVLQILAGAAACLIVYTALTAYIYSLNRHANGDDTYTWLDAAWAAAKGLAIFTAVVFGFVAAVFLGSFAITGGAL